MTASFDMQLHVSGGVASLLVLGNLADIVQVGRFYIFTLGLRDITSSEDIGPAQMPGIVASISAALAVQGVAETYGIERLRHSTEFTLISISVSTFRPLFARVAGR